MKPPTEADVIADHVFEDERKLRLAVKVGLAFPTIKEKIIRKFVQSLVLELEARLGKQWVVTDYWTDDPLQKERQVALAKSSWLNRANIGLECEKAGPSDLLYFVWRASRQKASAITDLKQSLDDKFSHGNHYSPSSGGDTLWWKHVDPPYRDWTDEDMLVALWWKKEAIEYYANRLVKICKIAGPSLDKLLIK